jgi:hypothetical protein
LVGAGLALPDIDLLSFDIFDKLVNLLIPALSEAYRP